MSTLVKPAPSDVEADLPSFVVSVSAGGLITVNGKKFTHSLTFAGGTLTADRRRFYFKPTRGRMSNIHLPAHDGREVRIELNHGRLQLADAGN